MVAEGKDIKILKGNIIYTKNINEFTIAENSYLVVIGNNVEGIYDSLPKDYHNIEIKDYKDKLIIPGLVDIHTHASQFAIRGIGYDKELLPWLNTYTFVEESKFNDLEYAKSIYKNFVNELYNQGTTRGVIFATIHQKSTEILMELLNEKGIVSYVGKVNMDRNSPSILIENTEESIKETINWVKGCITKYENVKPIITPRFVPSCTRSLMKKLGDISEEYDLCVQSHLCENLSEIKWVKELHPECINYSDVYYKYGLLGKRKTIMAHCIHLDENEINLIVKNNVFIAHCPSSNVNLSSGIAPIRNLINNGAKIGLGSDIAGGEELSMFCVMASAIRMSKLRNIYSKDTEKPLTIENVFYLGTKGGGEFFGKVGSFENGYEFDALVIDDDNLWKGRMGTIKERIERLLYLGTGINIVVRYVRGKEI